MEEKWENKSMNMTPFSNCKGHAHTKQLMSFKLWAQEEIIVELSFMLPRVDAFCNKNC